MLEPVGTVWTLGLTVFTMDFERMAPMQLMACFTLVCWNWWRPFAILTLRCRPRSRNGSHLEYTHTCLKP